jgi:hypothetical protein
MYMNPIRDPSVFAVLFLLVIVCAGCTNDPVAPIVAWSGDTLAFAGYFSPANIQEFDSFAASQLVKVHWRTGVGLDPPYLYFKETRVYLSSTSPDSGYREILRRTGGGEDSTVVGGLVDGNVYYFRAATYDSSGQLTSLSRPLMTIPGVPEPSGISVAAPQREVGEWVTYISWSHDGQQLAFLKTINNSVNIFVLQVSTMSINQVTNYTGTDYRLLSVSWSPDDQWLSYSYTPTSTAGSVDYRIWLVSPTGGNPRSITSGRVDAGAAWESSARLIFTKGTIGPPNIPEFYTVNLEDNNREMPITSDQAIRKYDPDFYSAHGLLVFRGLVVNPPSQSFLLTLPLTGGIPEPLTLNKYWSDIHPGWSADGQRIYFASSRCGHYEIWSIDFQSRRLRQVTRCQTRGINRFCGRQSPTGSKLALLEVGNQFTSATIQLIGAN